VDNPLALHRLKSMGFDGAIIGPELSGKDILGLPNKSPLPLGIVTHGLWPLGISRTMSTDVKACEPITSPMGEVSFVTRYGQNFWIYPNWDLDLREKEELLAKVGYLQLIHLREPFPKNMEKKERGCLFNWELDVL
jgi:putative protease